MKQLVKLKDISSYSKGTQINGKELIDDAKFDYLNGGINPSGKWNEANCEGNTITISEGGNSCGYVNFMKSSFWCGAHCYYLYDTVKNTQYLYYALKSQQDKIMKLRSGACMPNIKKADLGNFEFWYDNDINEQERITKILSKLERVIELRKQELSFFDLIISARFVEMFGDPIRNTHNRHTTEFSNVVKMQRGFDLPVQARQRYGNIPVYGSNGVLDYHNVAKIQGGGVITGRSGTIGKVFYTEGDYWPLNTSLFSVDTHGNNVIYLAYLLQMFDLSRFVEGTGVPTLNRNMFHDKQIIDVSLYEQEQFADFVKQVSKSKVRQQKNIHIKYNISIQYLCIQ